MLIHLSPVGLVVVNTLAWLVLHMAGAYAGTRMPDSAFPPGFWLYRPRRWERGGKVYERMFRIRAWKDRLPDGAALFTGGFRKKNMQGRDPEYLRRFLHETCRAEAVHEAVLVSSLLFFLWNPVWVGWVMIGYAVLANGPCILAQRYNRIRLLRLPVGR
jgi:glycosyl-4,4'-diaponeurosporenoate acyltransferase